MPYLADTRVGFWDITLNVASLCEELQTHLEKTYTKDIKEGSEFWYYVSQIEREVNLNDAVVCRDFWDWFLCEGNYNNVEEWNTIESYFVEEQEDGECDRCGGDSIVWCMSNGCPSTDCGWWCKEDDYECEEEVCGYVGTDEDDDEIEGETILLKPVGFRPQTRIGECEGCKMICEECELLEIVEPDKGSIPLINS